MADSLDQADAQLQETSPTSFQFELSETIGESFAIDRTASSYINLATTCECKLYASSIWRSQRNCEPLHVYVPIPRGLDSNRRGFALLSMA